MRAALIREFKKEFSVEEVEEPAWGDKEVLVRIRAACLCATDIKIREGRFPHLTLPLIPGHEVAGEVVETGREVKSVRVGDRVIVYMYTVCGACPACRRGRENLCARLSLLGFHRHGGHAEYVSVPESQLLILPDSIPFEEGAAIPDAVTTMLHAIRDQGRVKADDCVLIIGLGGLGLHGVQIARQCGGRVIAVGRSKGKLEASREMGAEWALDGNGERLVEEILSLTGGQGVDVVIDLVGNQVTFETAQNSLRKGGRLVMVGSTLSEVALRVGPVISREITIQGAQGANKQTAHDAVALCASRQIRPYVTERHPLEDINEAARRMAEGRIIGRSVLIP